MFRYELDLVEKFIQLKMSNNNFVRECPFRWGNIDLVEYETTAVNYLNSVQLNALKNKENLIVFSLLYKRCPHTLDYISNRSGFNIERVTKILDKLEKIDIIDCVNNLYTINDNIDFPDIIVKSYEMKLSDLKKAINQAVINKKYSDYSYVVMPYEKYRLCMEYKALFQSCSIGLLLVNDNKVTEVIRAKKINEKNYDKLISKVKIIHELENIVRV